jgi:uncharacterized cupin superfamily protein
MPKIDLAEAPEGSGTRYPKPFDEPCKKRSWKKLGDAAGLTQFGVNLMRLAPGVWSSQRHWHSHEDELVYVVSGQLVLVTDEGEDVMRAGDSVGWKAGVKNGHHLQNRSKEDAVFIVVGTRNDDDYGEYPDIDLKFAAETSAAKGAYLHKDGTPY